MVNLNKNIINIINRKIISIFQEKQSIRMILQNEDLAFEEYMIELDDSDLSDSTSLLLDITFDSKSIINETIKGYNLEEKIIKKSMMGSELYYILEIKTSNGLVTALFKVMSEVMPNGIKIKRKYNLRDHITINRRGQSFLKGFEPLGLLLRPIGNN